jgi:hypothetical protein
MMSRLKELLMAIVRRVVIGTAAALVALLLFAGGWLIGRLGIGSVVSPDSLSDGEREFTERMRNVTMVGSYTMFGREDRAPRTDRYEISSVEKVGDDLWRFNARMDCCGFDGRSMPIVVPMRWNGDTPTIMMTDTGLPGIGTYTVRVFFYGSHYAGTWQQGTRGGYMWGRIEKQE